MSWVAALTLLATGVFLPTFDVYSNLLLSARILAGNYYNSDYCKSLGKMVKPHPKFWSAMLVPFLLSWFFVTIQWFKTERGLKQKLKTLPLLIFQVYPQWRALRVLFYAKWKKDNRWQRMNEEWETGISHLGKRMIKMYYNFGLKAYQTIVSEPFLESVPQVHILMVIYILSINSPNPCNKVYTVGGDTLFINTFSTSIVTASFGISKFIKSGPARIVKNDKCLIGFGTLSFLLIFTNIALTLVGKGCIIALYVYINNNTYFVLLLLCFLPQLFHVSSSMSADFIWSGGAFNTVLELFLHHCRHTWLSASASVSRKQHQQSLPIQPSS